MKYIITQNATGVLAELFAQDSSKTDGSGLAGLAFNSAGLTAYYHRQGDASATAITLATMTVGTWATGGFAAIDGTNMPGAIQAGLPNACFTALGAVMVYFKGATNMAPIVLEIQVVAFDPKDGVRLGLTALPNATAGANTGLPVVGTQIPNATAGASGGLPTLNSALNVAADLQTIKTQTVTCSAGVTVGAFVGNATHALVVDASGFVTVATNNDKMGYGLTQAFPTNFSALAITAGGAVTAGTVSDKTGYSLTQAFPTNFAALGISAGGHISNVDTLTTYTGDTPQTGDSFARLGSPAGASVSADIAAVKASVGSPLQAGNVTVGAYAAGQDPATLVLAGGIETGVTLKQTLQRIGATTAGKLSGSQTGTEVFLGLDGLTTRVTVTADTVGNRTAVVYA